MGATDDARKLEAWLAAVLAKMPEGKRRAYDAIRNMEIGQACSLLVFMTQNPKVTFPDLDKDFEWVNSSR